MSTSPVNNFTIQFEEVKSNTFLKLIQKYKMLEIEDKWVSLNEKCQNFMKQDQKI